MSDEYHKTRMLLKAVEVAKSCADEDKLVMLINKFNLAREHLSSSMLNSVAVWSAMLPKMPLTALTRNLAKMTAIGLLKPLSDATATVVAKLTDAAALKRERLHPFTLLVAFETYVPPISRALPPSPFSLLCSHCPLIFPPLPFFRYRQGHGQKGSLVWTPTPEVVSALEKAFYLSFGAVTPTGKRYVLGLDVSGSMTGFFVAGSCVTAAKAAAAMAMVTLKTEKRCHTMALSNKFVPLLITPEDNLFQVQRAMSSLPFGSTDCAQPMLWAAENNIEADVFIVYTDCETWAGKVKTVDALRAYREKMGIDAKLVVVAMTSGGFTIADPKDAGMLDVVGFDTATHQIMQEFIMGNV